MVKTFKRSIAILCCLAITLSPMVSVTPAQASGVDLVVRLGGSENPWPVHAEDEIKLEFEGPPVPFNITREFTALGVSLLSANLRLHTADSENNFYIDDIFISVGGDVIYDMQTDSLVPEIGESLGSGGGSTMVINDNAKVTIVEYEGKKSLYCTNRPANWHAISVRYEALKALVGDNDCTLTILGRVEPEEAPEPGPDDVMWSDVPSLKDTYKDYFLIGNISNPGITIRGEANEIMTEMFSYHYNSVTGENHFKPDSYRSSKGGKYDFANKDDTMAWAKDNGLQVYGHALAWHSQSAPWLHPEGTTRAEARANMEEFFSQIAGHFEAMYDHSSPNSFGNLTAWDVLNEAHLERSANWRENLRTDNDGDDSSPWYAAYENGADTAAGESGADYIYDMFVLARKYAPSSTSYYSDFNDDNATKSAAIAAMVNELNAQWAKDTDNNPDAGDFNGSDDRAVVQAYLDAGGRLLIEGIAMQAHYNTQVRPENVRASLERFAATGAMVSITELDITIDPDHVGENEDKIQALLYAELFAIYKEFSDVVERVTFWGLRDNMSWRSQGNPLIFEGYGDYFFTKESFQAVIDPEGYLAANKVNTEPLNTLIGVAVKGTPILQSGVIDPIWEKIPMSEYAGRFIQGSDGATAGFKVMWDDANLYVLAVVTDPVLSMASAEAYEHDSVEVFFSPSNNKEGSYIAGADGQYRVNYANVYSGNPDTAPNGFESFAWETDGGYIVQMKIPFQGDVIPTLGSTVGFDIQINDDNGEGKRTSAAVWCDTSNGSAWGSTSGWGELILGRMEEDAPAPTNEPAVTSSTPDNDESADGANYTLIFIIIGVVVGGAAAFVLVLIRKRGKK